MTSSQRTVTEAIVSFFFFFSRIVGLGTRRGVTPKLDPKLLNLNPRCAMSFSPRANPRAEPALTGFPTIRWSVSMASGLEDMLENDGNTVLELKWRSLEVYDGGTRQRSGWNLRDSRTDSPG